MPKVIVEFDLPDGQLIPDPLSIVQLTSPDWYCDWWHIEDVQSVAEDLSDDEARKVLRYMARKPDASMGINWETIELWADIVKKERPKEVVYGFLFEDPNNHQAMYGIEYSTDEGGTHVYESEFCSTKLSRDLHVMRMKSEGVIFPREEV